MRERKKKVSSRQQDRVGDQDIMDKQQLKPLVTFAFVVIAMVVAVLLRIPFLNLSLWLDELHTSWVVIGSWSDVAGRARIGSSSPVYFWLVWGVVQVLGSSEITLRLLSVVASVLCLPLGYQLARAMGSTPVAALSVPFLLAIDWERIHFGTDARPYALVELLTLWQVLSFWRAMNARSFWAHTSLVLSSLLLISVHYVAGLLLLAEGVFLGCSFVRGRGASTFQWLAVDAAIILLGCLPIANEVLKVVAYRSTLEHAVRNTPAIAIFTFFPIHLYVLLPATIAMVLGHGKRNDEGNVSRIDLYPSISFCIAWTFLPTSLAWIIAWLGIAPVFVWRYLVFAALGPVLLAGILLSCLPAKRYQWLSVAAVVMVTGWFNSTRSMPNLEKHRDDWRSAIAHLNERITSPASVVYLRSELFESEEWWNTGDLSRQEFCQFPLQGLYHAKVNYLFPLPISMEFELTPQHVAATHAAESCWVVCRSITGDTTAEAAQALSQILSSQLSTADVQVTVGEIERFGAIAAFPLVVERTKQGLSPRLFGN